MKLFLFVLTFLFTVFQVKSQTSILGNAGGSLNYLGWDVNQTFPLTIKHEAPMQPINFYTNAGAGSLLNLRMFIEPNGNIGVGNFTPANTLFHIHQSNDGPVNFQMTDILV